MPKYALAVLVEVEAEDEDFAIEKVADALKGVVHDWSFSRAIPTQSSHEGGDDA